MEIQLNTINCMCLNYPFLYVSPCAYPAAAAAVAASLQSCPTLCNPIDGSPPRSAIPGILQARTLEWVASSFSNAWKWKVKVKSLSRVRLLATPRTAAHQAPPSMGFSRQEYWSGVPLPSPSLITREMQIKTTPVRIAIIKKSTTNKRWKGYGEKGILLHCWWDLISLPQFFLICIYTILNSFLKWPVAILGEGNGTPLQYFCLENLMDGGAW